MKTKQLLLVLVSIAGVWADSSAALAQYQPQAQLQTPQATAVDSATNVLNEFITLPAQGIPRSMLEKAQGLVIVPGMIKVGFIAGVRRGKGLVVIRDEQGAWRAPAFVTMTGGSVGWQAGVQSADVILVFNTRNSVNNLLRGKFTIGVDAAAAAGPVGRQASAGTDGRLQAEIYSYSRSRGLFVGASIDGSVIEIETAETQAYYQAAGFLPDGRPATPNAQVPPSAVRFLTTLASFTAAGIAGASEPTNTAVAPDDATATGVYPPQSGPASGEILPPTGTPTGGSPIDTANPSTSWVVPPGPLTGTNPGETATTGVYPPGTAAAGTGAAASQPNASTAAVSDNNDPLDATRRELAQSAKQLGSLLNESWRQYLALPKGVFSGEGVPTQESLQQSLTRFDAVAKDSRYNRLLRRQEFQQTYGLLRTYLEHVRLLNEIPAAIPSAGAPPAIGVRATIR